MGRRHSIIFYVLAIFAVSIALSVLCRTFLFEIYRVAPCQMENTLLNGDRVSVEKWHYGIRLPQYYFSLPIADTIAGTAIPAHYPSRRIFFNEVHRNDVVVFNYPTEQVEPLSKCPTAISRCVGIPGDTISALNGILYINGTPSAQSPIVTEAYLVADSLLPQVEQCMIELFGDVMEKHSMRNATMFYIDRYCYDKLKERLPEHVQLSAVTLSQDNYVVTLPLYNEDTHITPDNAAFYARIINQYEPVKVELHDNALYRGGRKISKYRFTQPYYWVLSDNRTAITDSRTFGVLPHSHIIGQCQRTIFSLDNTQGGIPSVRMSRFFKSVR